MLFGRPNAGSDVPLTFEQTIPMTSMARTLLLLSLLFASTVHASEKPVASKLTEAKVFLRGAQVNRSASTTVPAGTSTLVFTGLAQSIDPQSIQVTGKGGYSILSVNHRINYLTESPNKKEIEDLKARIKKLEHDYFSEENTKAVWDNEEQLLMKNWAVGGQQNGVNGAQLQGVNDYVRTRLTAVKAGQLTQKEKMAAINEELTKLRQQLQQMQNQAPRPTGEIVVEISSSVEVNATFNLTYFDGNAGWVPAYDLRAETVGKPIELVMKARITNNTGEDWNKVKLSLSSGNPTQGGIMPTLRPWILEQPIMLQMMEIQSTRGARNQKAPAMAPSMGADAAMMEDMDARTEVGNTVVYNTTTVEFSIDVPFTVPADGQAHSVGVRSHDVPALYKHYCTPKLDKDAFLYARTTGWEDLNLLPGEANVFFEGTYVGRSFLDLSRPQDTLNISLGRDKGVVVERVKRKGFSEKPIIGGKRQVTIGWDLTVRNTKSAAVDLEVKDQYPVSSRSEVEVKLEDAGGATVDKDRGALSWTMRLEAKASKKIGFTYSVKHPKDEPVVLE